ncbi:MAG: SiaB family protein kinase [Bacteroidales bacterium]|nr:SiaB family protein kinase [Bacteroidales bacterium]
MNQKLIKEFYRAIHFDDLTIAYSGNFSESMTDKIIELSEAYLESNKKLAKLKKRTSFLVAECFQNVVRHGKRDRNLASDRLNDSFFMRFYNNRCYIASMNTIPNNQVRSLKSKLDTVNLYNKKELRLMYRSILEAGEFMNAGGAGLGLIEMARKTGNKLEYMFEPQGGDNSSFYLLMVLENAPDENGTEKRHPDAFEEIRSVIKNVQEDNMFLLYKGDFEKDIIGHIEQIIERNLDTQYDSLAAKIKLYHAAILTMHKIGHFSARVDNKPAGMLFLGRYEDGYMINATFPVEYAIKQVLEKILSEIRDTGDEELDKKYNEQLKAVSSDEIPPQEIGFTQLTKMGKSWDFAFNSPEGLMDELVYQVII